ncbi:hypothetical protein T492DRAFT_920006 [Pavlovales sp. CCMP2436]|nr:hypothetical protein T492DRAFT_920006 [Pavlovales sp. CCMP2436]
MPKKAPLGNAPPGCLRIGPSWCSSSAAQLSPAPGCAPAGCRGCVSVMEGRLLPDTTPPPAGTRERLVPPKGLLPCRARCCKPPPSPTV